jgi:hypothetical protein
MLVLPFGKELFNEGSLRSRAGVWTVHNEAIGAHGVPALDEATLASGTVH